MKLSFNARVIVLVFAGIVVTALLSLFLFGFVTLIEHIALPWYHGEKQRG
jgi:ABC-type nitrate/sulfonate/bicarbonate transport system permease component